MYSIKIGSDATNPSTRPSINAIAPSINKPAFPTNASTSPSMDSIATGINSGSALPIPSASCAKS